MNLAEANELVFQYFLKKNLPLRPALAFDDVAVKDQFSDINSRSDIQDTKT